METPAEWKSWRIAHHMSQKSLAIALGLGAAGGGKKTVWGIENGKHKPSYTTLARFDALKERYAAAIRNRTEAPIGR